VGFALGVDRIVLSSGLDPHPRIDVYVVAESTPADALVAASRLRAIGLRVEFDTEGKPVKTQFRAASRSGSGAVVVVRGGDEPVDARVGGERRELPLEEAASWLIGLLR
jgi:histidyl-tRNA synthetase